MRANGVAERYCTGEAEPWTSSSPGRRTVPHTLRNPLYHWTHLELKRYFGIDELLDEQSAARIWKKANEQLAGARTDHPRHPQEVQRHHSLHHGRPDRRPRAP